MVPENQNPKSQFSPSKLFRKTSQNKVSFAELNLNLIQENQAIQSPKGQQARISITIPNFNFDSDPFSSNILL